MTDRRYTHDDHPQFRDALHREHTVAALHLGEEGAQRERAQVEPRRARLEAAHVEEVLHEAAEVPLAAVPMPLVGDVGVVVGPEGGVAPDELDRFAAAGAHVVRLGPTVLRTSTAGPAALAALSLRLGRWE